MKYFIVIFITFLLSSCVIGTKKEVVIVYSSISKPIEYKGLIRVAQNKKIKVTINNKPSLIDAGGYYLIHKADLKKLLDIAKGKIND